MTQELFDQLKQLEGKNINVVFDTGNPVPHTCPTKNYITSFTGTIVRVGLSYVVMSNDKSKEQIYAPRDNLIYFSDNSYKDSVINVVPPSVSSKTPSDS
jgi:hypothetical protein